jgi:Na+/H+-dicarboxylate symporter
MPLYLQTLIGMLLGIVAGLLWGARIAPLADIAKWIIQVIKFLAIPLLFFAIFEALLRRDFHGRGIAWMFSIAALNGLCAITIGLVISNLFQPGKYLPLKAPVDGAKPAATAAKALELIGSSPMIGAIVTAVLLGVVLLILERFLGANRFEPVRHQAERGLKFVTFLVEQVVRLIPLAVFVSVAKMVGEHGFSLLGGLGAYFFSCLAGMLIHVFLVYHTWILAVARLGFRRFWAAAREPVIYAFGINSSLATLPATLKALDKLGVSPGSARLSACVGTNFNNDGILLYEVVAVLFLSQAYGHDLGLVEQIVTALICVVATIGVGGIPEAGIISLSLVLGAVKLPVEGIPLLLTVDWVLARCRSSVNVLGDMTVAIGIDTFSRGANAAPDPRYST